MISLYCLSVLSVIRVSGPFAQAYRREEQKKAEIQGVKGGFVGVLSKKRRFPVQNSVRPRLTPLDGIEKEGGFLVYIHINFMYIYIYICTRIYRYLLLSVYL